MWGFLAVLAISFKEPFFNKGSPKTNPLPNPGPFDNRNISIQSVKLPAFGV
jgi:hypothetical protein